jgi:hypothetical protein
MGVECSCATSRSRQAVSAEKCGFMQMVECVGGETSVERSRRISTGDRQRAGPRSSPIRPNPQLRRVNFVTPWMGPTSPT